MKKNLRIYLLLHLALGLSLSMAGQRQSSQSAKTAVVAELGDPQKIVNDCPALKQQLVSVFGQEFDLNQSAVKAQLQRNIADPNADRCIRKTSLKLVYGSDYPNKLYLIDQVKK